MAKYLLLKADIFELLLFSTGCLMYGHSSGGNLLSFKSACFLLSFNAIRPDCDYEKSVYNGSMRGILIPPAIEQGDGVAAGALLSTAVKTGKLSPLIRRFNDEYSFKTHAADFLKIK